MSAIRPNPVEVEQPSGSKIATVTVFGRERIQAVSVAAARHLAADDEVNTTLVEAVTADLDCVELGAWEDRDAEVLAEVLADARNGDDPWPARAAEKLRVVSQPRIVECPHCDGTGEIEE